MYLMLIHSSLLTWIWQLDCLWCVWIHLSKRFLNLSHTIKSVLLSEHLQTWPRKCWMYSSFVAFKVVKKVRYFYHHRPLEQEEEEVAAVLSTSQMYFLQQHLESNQSHSHQPVPHTDTTSGYSSALPHRWLLEVICQKKSCAHQWILKQQLCRRRGEKAEQPPFVFFFGQLKFITRMAAEWRGLRGQCGRRSFVPLLAADVEECFCGLGEVTHS